MSRYDTVSDGAAADRYGAMEGKISDESPYQLQTEKEQDGIMMQADNNNSNNDNNSNGNNSNSSEHLRDGLMWADSNGSDDSDDEEEEFAMTMEELIYSSSSYYAIAKPVTLTMVLSALAVVYVNTDETLAQGEQAMADAYQMWSIDNSATDSGTLALSLANALVMVCVIGCMTFVIVLLYKYRFMKCLIGYMVFCSGTVLGILAGNLLQVAIQIYSIPVDTFSFAFFIVNFAIVGMLAIFFGQGIPKVVTQGYLIATSVILAWHLSYFDDWTIWTLLFMLAIYDLCAVLTPCGPLKALVELMSQEDSPDMPGLLFEADLPKEAKRPGVPKSASHISSSQPPTPAASRSRSDPQPTNTTGTGSAPTRAGVGGPSLASDLPALSHEDGNSGIGDDRSLQGGEGPIVRIPFAIARVYNLSIVAVPQESMRTMYPQRYDEAQVAASPLLQEEQANTMEESSVNLPEEPTPKQLRALVTCRLPQQGGRLEHVSKGGKKVYLERDRFGTPKRILWVDRNGKVFAEMRDDDEEGEERNSIRLGLGDFIFYSVLVAKAAQYSFATFAACTLVILAGLGGTLVLLSVYHHALPALPISIFLGVFFYLLTRVFVEPWIEAVMMKPYYV